MLICNLCGNNIVVLEEKTPKATYRVKPCQTCQDGAYANGYEKGYEDREKGKPKKENDSLLVRMK